MKNLQRPELQAFDSDLIGMKNFVNFNGEYPNVILNSPNESQNSLNTDIADYEPNSKIVSRVQSAHLKINLTPIPRDYKPSVSGNSDLPEIVTPNNLKTTIEEENTKESKTQQTDLNKSFEQDSINLNSEVIDKNVPQGDEIAKLIIVNELEKGEVIKSKEGEPGVDGVPKYMETINTAALAHDVDNIQNSKEIDNSARSQQIEKIDTKRSNEANVSSARSLKRIDSLKLKEIDNTPRSQQIVKSDTKRADETNISTAKPIKRINSIKSNNTSRSKVDKMEILRSNEIDVSTTKTVEKIDTSRLQEEMDNTNPIEKIITTRSQEVDILIAKPIQMIDTSRSKEIENTVRSKVLENIDTSRSKEYDLENTVKQGAIEKIDTARSKKSDANEISKPITKIDTSSSKEGDQVDIVKPELIEKIDPIEIMNALKPNEADKVEADKEDDVRSKIVEKLDTKRSEKIGDQMNQEEEIKSLEKPNLDEKDNLAYNRTDTVFTPVEDKSDQLKDPNKIISLIENTIKSNLNLKRMLSNSTINNNTDSIHLGTKIDKDFSKELKIEKKLNEDKSKIYFETIYHLLLIATYMNILASNPNDYYSNLKMGEIIFEVMITLILIHWGLLD